MRLPALSFIGWSGAGKTTLLARLVPELQARGLRVGVVKHSSHDHPLHPEGRDTAHHAWAGAALVAFATPAGLQLTLHGPQDVLAVLEPFADRVDLVLVEGWKDGPLPKVEVFREGFGPPLSASRPDVLALVSDAPPAPGLRRFFPEDVPGLATFILECLRTGALARRP